MQISEVHLGHNQLPYMKRLCTGLKGHQASVSPRIKSLSATAASHSCASWNRFQFSVFPSRMPPAPLSLHSDAPQIEPCARTEKRNPPNSFPQNLSRCEMRSIQGRYPISHLSMSTTEHTTKRAPAVHVECKTWALANSPRSRPHLGRYVPNWKPHNKCSS